jgi:hypothetical protein
MTVEELKKEEKKLWDIFQVKKAEMLEAENAWYPVYRQRKEAEEEARIQELVTLRLNEQTNSSKPEGTSTP